MRKPIRVDLSELQGEGAFVECAPPTVAEVLEFISAQGEYGAGAKLVADHVTAWNLADARGEPLALPGGDPALVSKLTPQEFRRVVDALLGQGEKAKN